MQTPDCATTWSERWREPLTSPRWLRAVLVFTLLVLGWPLGRLLSLILGALPYDIVHPFVAPQSLQLLCATGFPSPLAAALAGEYRWIGAPLALGFLGCIVGAAVAGLLCMPGNRRACAHTWIELAVSALAALLLAAASARLLGIAGILMASASLFALLSLFAALYWLGLLRLLRLARVPYPLHLLALHHMAPALMVDLSLHWQFFRAGVTSPFALLLRVLLSPPLVALLALCAAVALSVWAISASGPERLRRSSQVERRVIPLLAGVILLVSTLMIALAGLSLVASVTQAGPPLLSRLAQQTILLSFRLSAVTTPALFLLASCLAWLLVLTPRARPSPASTTA